MSLNLEINWRHMNEQWVIKLLLLRPTSKDENIKARGFLTCEGLVEAVNGRRTSTYLDVLPGLYNLLRKRGIDMMVARFCFWVYNTVQLVYLKIIFTWYIRALLIALYVGKQLLLLLF